jgi:ribonucleases P/MRP protein subunit RPP40
VFQIWIHIQLAPGSGSAFRMENFFENKTFAKTKIFISFFHKKRENLLAKFSRIYTRETKIFLGPLLFSIFINDLDDVATRRQFLQKFADDTKIGQIIDSPAASVELQGSLDRLCSLAAQWGMAFNMQKCHVMHVGRNNPRATYVMNGEQLTATETERDVGVVISHDLKQANQCKKAAQTASTVLVEIHCTFHFRDWHVYISLYKQYVRPQLEFAAPAWSPWNRGDIDCLEKVQERAVRAVSGLRGRSYKERISELGLPSLDDRRHEADMVQVYKILSEGDRVFSDQWFETMENARQTRHVDSPQLRAARASHGFRHGFFSMQAVDRWNSLPRQVKEAANVNSFK